MKRKEFLKLMSAGTGMLALSPALLACRSEAGKELTLPENAFSRPLSFPEEIRASEFELVAETARRKLIGGVDSDVNTLNGSLPPPTIRVKKGETLDINFQNRLDEESILHWHGLTVPPEMDGHPKDVVGPGEAYDYHFDVNQRAATHWYHPHPHGRTGSQIYHGLAGFFIIEDEEEQALNLPSGKYELPLNIQEKQINEQGQATYSLNMMDRMMGFFGNRLFVNSIHAPYHEVRTRFYRLRLLNSSNARILELSLSDDNPFYVIGSDGGLLEQPYEVSSVTLSPAERAELLVDFGRYEVGDSLRLEARTRNGMGGMMDGMMNNGEGMMDGSGRMMRNEGSGGMGGGCMMMQRSRSSDEVVPIVEFRITEEEQDSFQLPEKLTSPSFPNESEAERTRRFNLSMEMMQGSSINGRFFEMMRVDEEVPRNALEVWEFHGDRMMAHPMHIHATQFKVLDRSGGELAPHERGWKDTVLVNTDETVRVLVNFDAPEGMFVFHCHNLEHADNGMMANFEIIS